ncbi:acyltransferase family protein [Allonocardiopsis opalescens]|uniref:Fucose 4-O-acetylase-like acetyltransferase n=1 Tax=Allonocardiopsis opalescens TaxID=1144618 RepID=A0A2T0QCH3_9ACTN|nr:acyltransferase family protein [Allonocardiopsis opalescens]PRY01612.1 fucose 4-O-acetylase-like acetyltransferase [Allonocardiopsis opalescens]
MTTCEPTAPRAATEPRDTDRAGPAPPEPASRDVLLDNAKFLLIALVVIGHAISPARDTRLADALYFWIYLFHMPAFVLICGYLSKSFDGAPRRVDRLLTGVAVPYLIFWALYSGQQLLAGDSAPPSPLEPVWITWFLLALLLWRLSVPLWRRLRWPVAVAVGVSLATGVQEFGFDMSMSRVLSLLPFFVLGLALRPEHLEALRRRWVRVAAVLLFAAAFAATFVLIPDLSTEWVLWRETLETRDAPITPGLLVRAGFLAAAGLLALGVLALAPRRRTWFTALGATTMYVYLLHGLPIRIAEMAGWYDAVDGYAGLAVNTGAAVLLTLLLASRPVRWATRWAVEPRVPWVLARGGPGTGPEEAGTPSRNGSRV